MSTLNMEFPQDWFAKPAFISAVVTIDGNTATHWLDHNTHNRPLSPAVIERYRRDMEAGRWEFTGDPIRFSTMGVLLDGQHRLTAHSTLPDLKLSYVVQRGIDPDAQYLMDQGRKRTAGQQLTMRGVKHGANLAAGIKVYIAWSEGLIFRDNKLSSFITAPQIEEWYANHKDLADYVGTIVGAIRQVDAPPSVGAAAALRFTQIDPILTRDFFQGIAAGGYPATHPITTLDKRLQRYRREGLKMSNRDYLGMFVTAWNATRDGKAMTKFQRPNGGSWTAANFPEPK